jgi:acetyltransferase-like isoleucine patch superfamily enzyme
MFVTDDASEILLAPQSFIGSHVSVCVLNGGSLRVERNARINEFNNIRTVGGRIVIGENVLIAQFVSLIADNHRIPPRDQDIAVAGHDPGKTGITIGPGAWIGSNVVVLPGVEIGQGAVIGAGSVVTTSIPAYAVAAGNPARVIRYRE